MIVLSLFDGISCGRYALETAGYDIIEYHRWEVDKWCSAISAYNYPDSASRGDVFDADFTRFNGADLVIGGSPCQYWSIAKNGRETTPDGMGWTLFMRYVDAVRQSGCKYFLYENNHSIHRDIKAAISRELGVEPVMINSALVSAQSRKRCYWIGRVENGITYPVHIPQPDDMGLMLRDVLEHNAVPYRDKACTLRASAGNKQGESNTLRHIESGGQFGYMGVAEPVGTTDIGKAYALTATYGNAVPIDPVKSHQRTMAAVRVGTLPRGDGEVTNSKQYRIYSPGGKSTGLCGEGGGLGAKTGLYAMSAVEPQSENKHTVYAVENGLITIKQKQYPIKLDDGYYIIRKLTPVECERLQTLPDAFTANGVDVNGKTISISDTQRDRALGNGWTASAIVHLLRQMFDAPESDDFRQCNWLDSPQLKQYYESEAIL
jgi:DNA (cytosine-5)-methyltransferase 3A